MEKYTGGEINNYRNREPQRGSFCIGNDTINHTILCETYHLVKWEIPVYTCIVSTGNNPFRHGQLNTMISLDVKNSYALRRAADAPGSVGQT